MEAGKSPFIQKFRETIRVRNYSVRTEQAYIGWIVRYIRFCEYQHPSKPGDEAVESFLGDLSVRLDVSAATQNQALCALVFLYRHVIKQPLGDNINTVRTTRHPKLPVVLSRSEVTSCYPICRVHIGWPPAFCMALDCG